MIEQYLIKVLQPSLKKHRVPAQLIDKVKEDIELRLNSVLAIWNEPVKKNAVLILGEEIAEFYMPRAVDIEVRAFVVVGLRNSLLEDLHCEHEIDGKLVKGYIDEKGMKNITKEAISFFAKMDFQAESEKVIVTNNLFEDLAKKYPAAWRILEELGQLDEEIESHFEAEKPSDSIDSDLSKVVDTTAYKKMGTQSGICPLIRTDLYNALQQQNAHFFVDSFKMITRNPEKLMMILEYATTKNLSIVTPNYFLSNGFVSKADQLLKPAHMTSETDRKVLIRLQTKDISSTHLECLNMAFE